MGSGCAIVLERRELGMETVGEDRRELVERLERMEKRLHA